jgi:hypothetical protein
MLARAAGVEPTTLKAHELKQSDWLTELDQNIDIAFRASFPPRHRAKHSQRRYS